VTLEEQWKQYDAVARGRGKLLLRMLAQNKIILKNKLILDVGCGTGQLGEAFAEAGNYVVSIDISSKNSHIICDASCTPFKNHAFEIVLAINFVEHVKNLNNLINEVRRVLKKGGGIIIQTPNRWFPIEPHYLLPFLSWLPHPIAKWYCKTFRRKNYDVHPMSRKDVLKKFRSFKLRLEQKVWYPSWVVSGKLRRTLYSRFQKAFPLISPSMLFFFTTDINQNSTEVIRKSDQEKG